MNEDNDIIFIDPDRIEAGRKIQKQGDLKIGLRNRPLC